MKLNSCCEIAVFILNDEGQLLLQKQSNNKRYYPNMWRYVQVMLKKVRWRVMLQ